MTDKVYCPIIGCNYGETIEAYRTLSIKSLPYILRGNGKDRLNYVITRRIIVAMGLYFRPIDVIRADKEIRWREVLRMGADNIKTRKETLV